MPRVVANQKQKFDNDELFRKLSRESEVRYTGFREQTLEERRNLFRLDCQEGNVSIAIVGCGIHLQLNCFASSWNENEEGRRPTFDFVKFDTEKNKAHLKSQFIMNGVCVIWRGWIDLERLDGTGHMEYDEERALVEELLRQEQMQRGRCGQKIRDIGTSRNASSCLSRKRTLPDS